MEEGTEICIVEESIASKWRGDARTWKRELRDVGRERLL
jgi:hypothetical protein